MDSTASTSNDTDPADLVIVEDEEFPLKDQSSPKTTQKSRARKRMRVSSDSSMEDVLPDNVLHTEKNLQAAAIKNNLDDASVKKILKKVVTNDHVLALVKLREEEESSIVEPDLGPKITRAKARELMKVSPKSNAPWNLENLALTPIKQLPVKTRPEVKALIAHELQEDEDDEEYQPAHDEVPSEDEHTESDITFSDVDSQPRTPATPAARSRSPRVRNDGPFKVPQELKTPTRTEEPTIALRTRSKLSLSSTPIEHIESSFIPPDEVIPVVDDLWSQFLETCLDPTFTTRLEDDDEADPEYNVDGDPDANEEDEEALENSILKISKKELNDLVTELFHIMPEDLDNDLAGKNIANNGNGKDIVSNGKDIVSNGKDIISNGKVVNDNVTVDTVQTVLLPVAHFEGKQEILSDDEALTTKVGETRRFSIGKSEPMDCETDPLAVEQSLEETREERVQMETDGSDSVSSQDTPMASVKKKAGIRKKKKIKRGSKSLVEIQFRNRESGKQSSNMLQVPPLLKKLLPKQQNSAQKIEIVRYDQPVKMLPEQVLILEQQLRQHVQLATSNFLQLYIHPEHWRLGPTYKEFLETLYKMKPTSVAHVCNLKPAVELVRSWEKSVSENTPENIEMVEFLQNQIKKCRRRLQMNNVWQGDFHETFKKVIANSSVFLYPFLLPPAPYRCDNIRRADYRRSEDELVAMGLEQFFPYVKANEQLFHKTCRNGRTELKGLTTVIHLICKLMLPACDQRRLISHVHRARSSKDKHSPIYRYFESGEVTPVKHKIWPHNENITLYQQPAHELPIVWLRYVAQTSKQAKEFLRNRKFNFAKPEGMEVTLAPFPKNPPLDPNRNKIPIKALPKTNTPIGVKKPIAGAITLNVSTNVPVNGTNGATLPTETANTPLLANSSVSLFTLVETDKGAMLVPVQVSTATVNTTQIPITTPVVANAKKPRRNDEFDVELAVNAYKKTDTESHCKCCALIRKVILRQKRITDYFRKADGSGTTKCPCHSIEYPSLSHKLWALVNNYHSRSLCVYRDIFTKKLSKPLNGDSAIVQPKFELSDAERAADIAMAAEFQIKTINALSTTKFSHYKDRVRNLFQRFNPYTDSVVWMTTRFLKFFRKGLPDLCKDFVAFLTPAQAEEVDMFGDYFIQSCMTELVKRVNMEITDESVKNEIYKILTNVFSSEIVSSCDLFCELFQHFKDHPKLAEYLFSLFPHRRKMSRAALAESQKPQTTEPTASGVEVMTSECSQPDDAGNEADHSSEGEEDVLHQPLAMNTSSLPNPQLTNLVTQIKQEETDSVNANEEELIISKTEMQDYDSDRLHVVMSDDESIKVEAQEWNKDEDKIILEMLKDHFTSDERKDVKTVLDNMEEMDIFQVLAEEMLHRSVPEIKERVAYLLELLVMFESD